MGSNPNTSVVNRYLQSWDVPNVFVIGASAYQQNASWNPTGTLGALTYWTIDALKNKYLKNPRPLDRHRRFVDEYTHGEREAPQRHDIERFADRRQRANRPQDRQRNRGRDDQSRAPAAEKQQDHQAGERRGDHALADHSTDRGAHECRLIADRLDIECVRQRRLDDLQHLLDAADDVEGGGRTVLEHTQEHRAIAVNVDHIGLHRIAIVHMRHVVHIHHRTADVLDRQVAELLNCRRRAVEIDRVFGVPDLLRAHRRDEVLGGECIGDVEPRQAAGL